jgi:hypothetical protein
MPRTDTALTFEQAVEGESQVVHALDGFVVEGRSAQTADPWVGTGRVKAVEV